MATEKIVNYTPEATEALKAGYLAGKTVEALAAELGKTALEVYRKEKPDIILLDPNERHTLSARTHHMNVDYSGYEGMQLTGKVKIKQLVDSATMTQEYRKIIYGSTSGSVPIKNFFQGGALVVALDNGLTSTNSRTDCAT